MCLAWNAIQSRRRTHRTSVAWRDLALKLQNWPNGPQKILKRVPFNPETELVDSDGKNEHYSFALHAIDFLMLGKVKHDLIWISIAFVGVSGIAQTTDGKGYRGGVVWSFWDYKIISQIQCTQQRTHLRRQVLLAQQRREQVLYTCLHDWHAYLPLKQMCF